MVLKNLKVKSNKVDKNLFRESTCPVCNKTFVYICDSVDWGWRLNNTNYCSYKCMRVVEKQQMQKKLQKELDKEKHNSIY